ncbi:MAG: hypothetical protein IPP15_12225 [Saprospiraceae bacterium]|uniref:Uncharacterized protein n=1 Tax=Candidatus Opimibacter skivensis TaxID=2982028 RepID=A0A9D7SVT3_9BACT|nr:hypothetical protein [Candidatus Opimibacter skivensis]
MPSNEDIKIFKQILALSTEITTGLTAPQFEKVLGRNKIFKSNANERQGLLETLGYLGIFENPEYPSYFEQYIPRNYQPTKSTRGYYNYPVEWWRTTDGINIEALEFWFGPWIN